MKPKKKQSSFGTGECKMTEFMLGLITGIVTALPWAIIIVAVIAADKGKSNE